MVTFRVMRRAMEKETGGRCDRKGEINPCYSPGHSRTSIPHCNVPSDSSALHRTQHVLCFVEPVYRPMPLPATQTGKGRGCPIRSTQDCRDDEPTAFFGAVEPGDAGEPASTNSAGFLKATE